MAEQLFMTPDIRRILTINAGSSSIKFALFEGGETIRRVLNGKIEGIGFQEGRFAVKSLNQTESVSTALLAQDPGTTPESARTRTSRRAPAICKNDLSIAGKSLVAD